MRSCLVYADAAAAFAASVAGTCCFLAVNLPQNILISNSRFVSDNAHNTYQLPEFRYRGDEVLGGNLGHMAPRERGVNLHMLVATFFVKISECSPKTIALGSAVITDIADHTVTRRGMAECAVTRRST